MTETTTAPTETAAETRTTTLLLSLAEMEAIASMRHMTTMRENEEILEHVLLELSPSGWRASATDRYAVVEQSYTSDQVYDGEETLKLLLHRDLLDTLRRTYCKGTRSYWRDKKIVLTFEVREGAELVLVKVSGEEVSNDMSVLVEKGERFPAVTRLFPAKEDLHEVPFLALGMGHLQRLAKVISPEEAALTPGKRFSGFMFRAKERGVSQMIVLTKVLGSGAQEDRTEWGCDRKFRVVLQGLVNKHLEGSW